MIYTTLLAVLVLITMGILAGTILTRSRLLSDLYSVESCMDVPELSSANEKVQAASDTFCAAVCPCNNFYQADKVQGSAISMLKCRLCESTDPDVMAFVATKGGEPYCKSTAGGKTSDFRDEYFGENWLEHADLMTWMEETLD